MGFEVFDQVLKENILRLTGGSGLPGGLSIHLETILCLILLEQLHQQAQAQPPVSASLSEDLLLKEAVELGIPQDVDLERALVSISEKGYIKFKDQSSFEVLPPFHEACKLLANLFPSMSGLNMLAYIIQTLEEVNSGRKDITQAAIQFGDTLDIHSREPQDKFPETKAEKREAAPRQDLLKKLKQAAKRGSAPSSVLTQEEEVSAKGFEVFDIFGGEKEEDEPLTDDDIIEPITETPSKEQGAEEIAVEDEAVIENDEPALSTDDPPQGHQEEEVAPDTLNQDPSPHEEATVTDGLGQDVEPPHDTRELEEEKSPSPPQREPAPLPHAALPHSSGSEPESEDLEEKFRRFQEELENLCPLCNKGKLRFHTTPAGKKYYDCSQKSCHFISWGKPLRIPCPRCNNPFLVEMEAASGVKTVKCPRATCGYKTDSPQTSPQEKELQHQPDLPPGPKVLKKARKVRVRRRLVKRR